MIYLTILNTLAIVYLIIQKKSKYYLKFEKEMTFFDKTIVGYRLSLWKRINENSSSYKYALYFPIRNRKKTETQEEVRRMISTYSQQNKLQSLAAKFSWLKTWNEVRQFEKDYSVVNEEIVSNLVSKFVPKTATDSE